MTNFEALKYVANAYEAKLRELMSEEDFDVFSSQVAIDMIVEDAHNANDQDFQKALFDFIDKLEGDDNDVQ